MTPLPATSSDNELISFVDHWAATLENEEYEKAFYLTEKSREMNWTPELIQKVIKSYGDARPAQRVTLKGKPTDITQRKKVTRWPKNKRDEIGEVWYDLNIDGLASDLTATFEIVSTEAGLLVRLNDIHVM